MTHTEINVEICKALGLDPGDLQKVVITLLPGKPPAVELHKYVKASQADSLATAVTMLELRAVPAEHKTGGPVHPGRTYRVGE